MNTDMIVLVLFAIYVTSTAINMLVNTGRASIERKNLKLNREWLEKSMTMDEANLDYMDFCKERHLADTDERIRLTVLESIDKRINLHMGENLEALEELVKSQVLQSKMANRDMEVALGIESE